jgi:hypothetical protein
VLHAKSSLVEEGCCIDVGDEEDNRAVLTDYMYRFPDKVMLDYDQQLIAQAREGSEVIRNEACPSWAKNHNEPVLSESRRLDFLSETTTETRPLFLFSPRYLGCDESKKPVPTPLPQWDDGGIKIDPILGHIDRVVNAKESIVHLSSYGRLPDYRQVCTIHSCMQEVEDMFTL